MSRQLNAMHTGPRREDWETPPQLFRALDDEFYFHIDVCATPENAKTSVYFTEADDALSREWADAEYGGTVCWMNPPYGKPIGKWVEKAYRESLLGNTVVCLVPARTDAAWWHDYASQAEIRFIRGRIKFVGAKYNAPFPSAILVFRPTQDSHTCVLRRVVEQIANPEDVHNLQIAKLMARRALDDWEWCDVRVKYCDRYAA